MLSLLHSWSSCVRLPVQRILIGIAAEQGLTLLEVMQLMRILLHLMEHILQFMMLMLIGTNKNLIEILIIVMYCLFVIVYKDILKVERCGCIL